LKLHFKEDYKALKNIFLTFLLLYSAYSQCSLNYDCIEEKLNVDF